MIEKLPEKMGDFCFKRMKKFNEDVGHEAALAVLRNFACFSKATFETHGANAFTVDVFRMASLQPWIDDIDWHSNHLVASWNPKSFKIPGTQEEKTIFNEHGMNSRAAKNFKKFVNLVVRPAEDPLALILFIISDAGNNMCYTN